MFLSKTDFIMSHGKLGNQAFKKYPLICFSLKNENKTNRVDMSGCIYFSFQLMSTVREDILRERDLLFPSGSICHPIIQRQNHDE